MPGGAMLNVNTLTNRASNIKTAATTAIKKVEIPGLPVTKPASKPVVVTKPNDFIKPKEEEKQATPAPPMQVLPAKPSFPKPPMQVLPAKPIQRFVPPPSNVPDRRPPAPITMRPPAAIERAKPRVYTKRKSRRGPSPIQLRRARQLRNRQLRKPGAWNPYPPTNKSFMRPVKPGQFTFSPRVNYAAQQRKSAAEIKRLKNQINTLNADALKTKKEYEAERAAIQKELEAYESSVLVNLNKKVGDNAKGVFEVLDKGAKLATPSINGIDGFPYVSEGVSRGLAAGLGLFAFAFLIGRVE